MYRGFQQPYRARNQYIPDKSDHLYHIAPIETTMPIEHVQHNHYGDWHCDRPEYSREGSATSEQELVLDDFGM